MVAEMSPRASSHDPGAVDDWPVLDLAGAGSATRLATILRRCGIKHIVFTDVDPEVVKRSDGRGGWNSIIRVPGYELEKANPKFDDEPDF